MEISLNIKYSILKLRSVPSLMYAMFMCAHMCVGVCLHMHVHMDIFAMCICMHMSNV